MLNLFTTTGHLNHAKSARIYLQLILDLPNAQQAPDVLGMSPKGLLTVVTFRTFRGLRAK